MNQVSFAGLPKWSANNPYHSNFVKAIFHEFYLAILEHLDPFQKAWSLFKYLRPFSAFIGYQTLRGWGNKMTKGAWNELGIKIETLF